eukprot:3417900-Amphidinium_carterae.1
MLHLAEHLKQRQISYTIRRLPSLPESAARKHHGSMMFAWRNSALKNRKWEAWEQLLEALSKVEQTPSSSKCVTLSSIFFLLDSGSECPLKNKQQGSRSRHEMIGLRNFMAGRVAKGGLHDHAEVCHPSGPYALALSSNKDHVNFIDQLLLDGASCPAGSFGDQLGAQCDLLVRCFLDVSVDGQPAGRIVVGLYGKQVLPNSLQRSMSMLMWSVRSAYIPIQ